MRKSLINNDLKIYTVDEVAKYLGANIQTINGYIHNGQLIMSKIIWKVC